MSKQVIIAGGGVAGLTAAVELLEKTDLKPIVLEMSDMLGGISKTVNYKGNYIDIGGHRFFSKSERVTQWWNHILEPTEFLERHRLSRIYYLKQFFDYPIKLNYKTLKQLGFSKVIKLAFSYTKAMLFPIKPEKSLEDFFINRFGKTLYETFFKDYTEKVWGVPCHEIKPEWGAQRIKGISIKKVIGHAISSKLFKEKSLKNIETSLIDRFLYPKYGVGQMWEKAGERVIELGGEIRFKNRVIGLVTDGFKVTHVKVDHQGHKELIPCDYFFSTMPVKELITYLKTPDDVQQIASELMYRDFISVGVLCNRFDLGNKKNEKVLDNWIYIQENSVKMGRIQIFNNWSPYMVKDPKHMWIGLEYFCNEGDEFWEMSDQAIKDFAAKELVQMNAMDTCDIVDTTIVRMPKAYPSYFGGYEKFDHIKDYVNKYENMYLIGRNGMHRYNNMDHSMLTAILAVENIINDRKDKDNLWSINSETDYHEEKK